MRNYPAVFSLVLGLLAVAALPVAIVYAEREGGVELIWAGVAVPVAFVLGVAALVIGRRGLRRSERTLARRGRVTARIGCFLGLIGMLLAGSGAIALLVYEFLSRR